MNGRLIAVLAALFIAGPAGATDVNRASQAELESIRGVGTVLSAAIVEERGKRPFASWTDLRARVKGVGPASAARLSAAGLTVGGAPYDAASAAR